MTPPKMSRAFRISEDSRRYADNGDTRGDIGRNHRTRTYDGTAADGLARDNAGAATHEHAISHADMARDIALRAHRGPRAD